MMAVPCACMRGSTENNRSISRFSNGAVGSSRMKMRHSPGQALGDGHELTLGKAQRTPPDDRTRHGNRAAPAPRALARACGRGPPVRSDPGGEPAESPSAIFSATDNAGTRRSSCGMVTIPAAIASCGLAKCAGSARRRKSARCRDGARRRECGSAWICRRRSRRQWRGSRRAARRNRPRQARPSHRTAC